MIAILHFLGTNCAYDLKNFYDDEGLESILVDANTTSLPSETSLAILAGGFSYGDYLRCGAIAARAKSIKALKDYAQKGGKVLGICNGFQILCEARMLPGVLMRNAGLKFISKDVKLKIESKDNAMLKNYAKDSITLPIAHMEGNYQVDINILEEMKANNQVLLTYENDINGAISKIAGICNKDKNIFALMPHPERAVNKHHHDHSHHHDLGHTHDHHHHHDHDHAHLSLPSEGREMLLGLA
ncbi:phosphoribosylformylglycinamidine synthase subunit PurQ [Helicobacter sp. 11S02629-2]|uniref:phosphoribosylformylglycinamidine synthase subunit PurQ n=1 Tax=Helicobacter sp. 11S02629-2 TaxID=1476195 RepID=UPI000BA5C40B|nr:phosphoribosylformylglycinamidine synthase subunit PurQ [Helicobacter sp. 11S02629-2]PAF44633.1 phosphoribosylformylglycinamidine synthase I [Helicobacter sp. 11S02629-2]